MQFKAVLIHFYIYILASSSSLFWFYGQQFYYIYPQSFFQVQFSEKEISDKPTKQQTDQVSIQLVNIVEHLSAREPGIFLRRWWRPKTELQESEYWTSIHKVAGDTTLNEC